MTDGRRHSVDIPISRTLVALRRVRSLRDPSTNSMSKFSALVDNVNWETDSSNGICLRITNDSREAGSDGLGALRSKTSCLNELREDYVDDFELSYGLGKSKLISCEDFSLVGKTDPPRKIKRLEGLDYPASIQEGAYENKSLSKIYGDNHGDIGLDLTCTTPSGNHLEDVDSCYEPSVGSSQAAKIDHIVSKQKLQYENQLTASQVAADVASHMDYPFPSANGAISSNSTTLLANEELDIVDHSHHGCGISYCWSRTPKSRESYLSSDVEEHPLLSGDGDGPAFYKQGSLRHISNQITPYSETPRCLSQKFRPKSFNELVGQNAVARSLLGAISKGRITSFYLFHGPRGTGKTSASRIFAAALNCLSPEHRPCGLCRECVLFFSGRSRDVKEVDSVRINRVDRVRSLLKSAVVPPVSSRFKVFIVDECQLLNGETWSTILNSLDSLSQFVVFVMNTPDLDKVPRSAVSRSQRYHFPKIKDADVASRLEKICVEEGLDFDQAALDFIASKSNGSLRDAEMMLDQLSLLGKRITMTLAYELIGVVSDDELLDLLDLALSSDTSNTVLRARELMRSRIDPVQLISQLANLIMDILAGKSEEDSSEIRRKFSNQHISEADMQKLSNALKVLSETEKQVRMSKNQSTWLTVALLQLSSMETSSLDSKDSKLCLSNVQDLDGDFCSLSSIGQGAKQLGTCSCEYESLNLGKLKDCKGRLESVWKKMTDLCQSNSLKKFLRKQGKLSSLSISQGIAVAELEFNHPNYACKAEKSWKQIASLLQFILGCNVEIRINLVACASGTKYVKVRKPSFKFFSCSNRLRWMWQSSTERGCDPDPSDYTTNKEMIRHWPILASSSNGICQMPHDSSSGADVVKTLRDSEGNALSIATASSHASLQTDKTKMPMLRVDSSMGDGSNNGNQVLSMQEPEDQPNCFPRKLRLQKRPHMLDSSQMSCSGTREENKHALSTPGTSSFPACNAHDPYVFCRSSNNYSRSSIDDNELRENSDVLCWRTPTFPEKKAWQPRHLRQGSDLVGRILPCATAK